jgi:hypothetical protein
MDVSGKLHVPAAVTPEIEPTAESGVVPTADMDELKKNFFPLPGNELLLLGRPAHSLVTMLTELLGLQYRAVSLSDIGSRATNLARLQHCSESQNALKRSSRLVWSDDK